MVNLSAAQRRHMSRIGYALGLLALVGTTAAHVVVVRNPAQVVVVRNPALSSTQLSSPVPAPAAGLPPTGDRLASSPSPTSPAGPGVYGESPGPPGVPVDPLTEGRDTTGVLTRADRRASGSRADTTALVDTQDDFHRSLVYSGLLGLAISLTGLQIVGTRRRMW